MVGAIAFFLSNELRVWLLIASHTCTALPDARTIELSRDGTPIDPSMKVRAYSHLLGESDVAIVGTKSLAKKFRNGFPSSLDGAPILLPMKNTILRRSLDYWFEENELRPKVVGEFDDSAMLKIMGSAGVGVFPVASIIRKEVEAMYGVEFIANIPNVSEKFYALSVERKVKHPAVLAISEVARKKLSNHKW